jgi:hypothetical protein
MNHEEIAEIDSIPDESDEEADTIVDDGFQD